MSAECQQRLRSLLAAYNVFSAKLRHHKVASGLILLLRSVHSERRQCRTVWPLALVLAGMGTRLAPHCRHQKLTS